MNFEGLAEGWKQRQLGAARETCCAGHHLGRGQAKCHQGGRRQWDGSCPESKSDITAARCQMKSTATDQERQRAFSEEAGGNATI